MANSSLASYTKLTANNSGKRTQNICKITPHYMADNGAFTGRGCADYFYNCGLTGSRQCSSNYCIGGGGDIAVSVNEDCRSWCSSSDWNDQRAVTIEVSCTNNTTGEITTAAWNALVNLCADICKRNNFKLSYDGTQNGSLTEHRMFASTACPGPYLHARMQQLCNEVNAKLSGTTASTGATSSAQTIYRVRKTWADSKSQIGAYANLENAKKACPVGYSVFDPTGKVVYQNGNNASTATTWDADAILQVGDIVKSRSCSIKSGIVDNCVNVPDLGGYVPLSDVTEASDSGDGNAKDNYIANDKAKVYLDECKVTEVDVTNDLVKVNGYWVKAGPLMAKR